MDLREDVITGWRRGPEEGGEDLRREDVITGGRRGPEEGGRHHRMEERT